jgi:hypothetical protein
MSGKPQPGARRPLCDGCRRQRRCTVYGDRRLCRECVADEVAAIAGAALEPWQRNLVGVLLERAQDGAVE